ncbi:MAG: GGDEF domain-containing protein [Clostridiales bacterium]|nr:GGDEF domain-containing protein [Clostridiales bacterium]
MTKSSNSSQESFNGFSRDSLFTILLNQIDYSVCFKDRDHRYTLCSPSFARLLGYRTPDELRGKKIGDFVSKEDASEHTSCEDRVMESKTPVLHLEKHLEISGPRSTIGNIWLSTSIYPLIDDNGEVAGTWSITRDISEEKNTEQKLMQKNKQCDELSSRIHVLSTIDEETGLYNRKYFEEMITRNMRLFSRVRGRGYSAGFSIILMDIDNFTKLCSDHGGKSGEVILKYVANILRSCSRSADDVFRVGNDEFALLLSDTGLTGAKVLSGRIKSRFLRTPLMLDEKEIYISLSFGFSTYEDQLDASELIVKADQDLFNAKKDRDR